MKLYPFQKEGVRFLLSRTNTLLADDMGLGKTIQALEVINRTHPNRVLIICPAGVKYNWAKEIERFLERPHTVDVVNGFKHRLNLDANITIVNYDLLVSSKIIRQLRDIVALSGGFDLAIVDEAHYLKNPDAKRTRRLLGNRPGEGLLRVCRKRILLTGTPVLNRPMELFPILETMAPEAIKPYSNDEQFGRQFCNGFREDGVWNFKGASNLDDLAKRLSKFMLRRTKAQVLGDLPARRDSKVYFSGDDFDLEYLESLPLSSYRKELGILKLPLVLSFCSDIIKSSTNKVVLFCHHREVVEALCKALPSVKFYGGMSPQEKQEAIRRFREDPSIRFITGNIAALGIGINGLQEVCSHAIFVEPDWSPGVMDQAIDRLCRIGQKYSVLAQYLVVEGSIDDCMYDQLNHKRGVIRRIMSRKETPSMGIIENLEARVEELENSLATLLDKEAKPAKGKKAEPKAAKGKAKAKPEPEDDDNWEDDEDDAPKKTKAKAKPVDDDDDEDEAPKKGKAKGPTRNEVKDQMQAYVISEGDECVDEKKKDVRKIYKKFGATKLSEVADSDLAAFSEALTKLSAVDDEDEE